VPLLEELSFAFIKRAIRGIVLDDREGGSGDVPSERGTSLGSAFFHVIEILLGNFRRWDFPMERDCPRLVSRDFPSIQPELRFLS